MVEHPLVLIADDDSAVRALLDAALHGQGYDTLLARNGQEALDLIRERDFDLVLLDVNMPVMTGIEALREIRRMDRSRTLPVILVTASDLESQRIRALESGADDYLSKPVDVKELRARVQARIRGRAAWTNELERGRESRRRLATALEELPADVPLLTLASELVNRLPAALDVDGVAILHFAREEVRGIASGGALRDRYPPAIALPAAEGREIAQRSSSGAWLEADESGGDRETTIDVAYVPFRLGPTPVPLGCLVFAVRPGGAAARLSHRLPDLIDATDVIVAVLRPAVERAESADAGITRLQGVIARHEFTIHLQPIVQLDTEKVVAAEALTRFASGMRPDLQFAEAALLGLGPALERTAISAAIEAAASLRADVALTVNLSADVLQHEPLLPEIVATANRPLIIELTEHERIDDYDAVRAAFDRLGSGVQLAIDDAGSGFASLRHIFALRPDYAKLDIEWVRGIDRDPVRRALVSGLVYFGRETGCQLIAEGIETREELEAVRELGIQLGQGFLLGKPTPDLKV